jgi:hypothetical protein
MRGRWLKFRSPITIQGRRQSSFLEILVPVYQITRRHIPNGRNIVTQRRKDSYPVWQWVMGRKMLLQLLGTFTKSTCRSTIRVSPPNSNSETELKLPTLLQGAVMGTHTSLVRCSIDCIQKNNYSTEYERNSLSLCSTNVIWPRQFTVTNWKTQLILVEGTLLFIWEWCSSLVYRNNCHGFAPDLLPYLDTLFNFLPFWSHFSVSTMYFFRMSSASFFFLTHDLNSLVMLDILIFYAKDKLFLINAIVS